MKNWSDPVKPYAEKQNLKPTIRDESPQYSIKSEIMKLLDDFLSYLKINELDRNKRETHLFRRGFGNLKEIMEDLRALKRARVSEEVKT